MALLQVNSNIFYFSLFLLLKAKGQFFLSWIFVGHITYTSYICDLLICTIILMF